MSGFHGGHRSGGGGSHGRSSFRPSGISHRGHGASYNNTGYDDYYAPSYKPMPSFRSSGHTVFFGRHYYNGVRYYGPYYGMSVGGKPLSFKSVAFFGVLSFIIGIIFFLGFFTVKTTATITDVSKVKYATPSCTNTWLGICTEQYYYEYDFTYTLYGNTYEGNGDDDEEVKTGETYPLYVHIINPSSYEFKNVSGWGYFLGSVCFLISGFIFYRAAEGHNDYKARLAVIGDINHDGKTDAKDIRMYEERKNKEMGTGNKNEKDEKKNTSSGMQDFSESAQARYVIQEKCPYCGKNILPNQAFCENCGTPLKNR